MSLRRGFKSQAEALALTIRAGIGVDAIDPVDPIRLAAGLRVTTMPLTDLAVYGADHRSIAHLLSVPGEFSAATIVLGQRRLIVYNTAQPSGRLANSLTHESSHIILEHQPHGVFAAGGCRRWDAEQEEEADYLAGAILVPRAAALRVARRGSEISEAANHYGVSEALMRWRINQTGAAIQARREHGRYARAR